MNIYLACTVRGDRGALSTVRAVADAVESMGHTVLTRHLPGDDADPEADSLTARAVFDRRGFGRP